MRPGFCRNSTLTPFHRADSGADDLTGVACTRVLDVPILQRLHKQADGAQCWGADGERMATKAVAQTVCRPIRRSEAVRLLPVPWS